MGATLLLDKAEKHKITLFGNQTMHIGNLGRTFREYNFQYSLVNACYSGQIAENLNLAFKAGLRMYNRLWQEDFLDTLSNDYKFLDTSYVRQMIVPLDLSLTFNHLTNSNFTVGIDNQQASYLT